MYQVLNQYKKTNSCNYHGLNFDSKKEGGEYRALEDMVEKGKLKKIFRQVRVDFYITASIISNKKSPDGKQHNGKPTISAKPRMEGLYQYTDQPHMLTKNFAAYKVDMVAVHNGEIFDDGVIEFIEVKGKQSPDWKKKWDLLEACFGNDDDYKLTIIK